jgi:hypothetical protein
MEKSKEEKAKKGQSSFEMVDTRPINGKSANRSTKARDLKVDLVASQGPRTFKSWTSMVAYWIREMLWRRRFWGRVDQGVESREDTSG